MQVTGIICEYNPFHLGHLHQLRLVREQTGGGICCLMSGNFVQRGAPALFDKQLRAQVALMCGADLVLELPTTCALSSAEGFASGGVKILSSFCHSLSFGAETGDVGALMNCARVLLSPAYPPKLREALESGCSFAAAREQALTRLGISPALVRTPNNILGIEYCKAILAQSSPMQLRVLLRQGDYHAKTPDAENPSATFLREALLTGSPWEAYVPPCARPLYASAPRYTWQAGERSVLARLRTMTDEEFQALPYGSEGLWRKFRTAAREEATLPGIFARVKSKRYAHSRISRMLLCAYLGIRQEILDTPVPYVRVLGFTETGREILKHAKVSGDFLNLGTAAPAPWQEREELWGSLYGLMREDMPDRGDRERQRRIDYRKIQEESCIYK